MARRRARDRAEERPGRAAIALRRFVNASEQGDFETAYRLLAAPLRARYTPKTFAEDFRREPLSANGWRAPARRR